MLKNIKKKKLAPQKQKLHHALMKNAQSPTIYEFLANTHSKNIPTNAYSFYGPVRGNTRGSYEGPCNMEGSHWKTLKGRGKSVGDALLRKGSLYSLYK